MKSHYFSVGFVKSQGGFNLIELMISMVLGLLVVGAAIGIFLSNRQAYAATEGVGRIQETARLGFELIARDIREAGANPCDKALPVANVLTAPTATWWKNWAQP
ncbi:prepilin-type N-terminal cleavage/methylation domain-containing protein [Xanthomonas perforans]